MIDSRSYRRQGLAMEPTIHEGVAARQMEQKGMEAERCQINRDVRQRNSIYLSAFSLAILVWFAGPVRIMIPVNLVLFWVILQAAGFVIEAVRRHRRDKQRYR